MLKAKRGLEVEYPAFRRLLIKPVGGMVTEADEGDLPLQASPDMLNCVIVQDTLRKRPGFQQYRAGNSAFSASVLGLFSTQDDEDNTHLLAVTQTQVKKYNSTSNNWDTLTGPALTGGGTQPFSFAHSQNSICFSQAVDQVQIHPLTGVTTYAVLNANCPPARYMTRFVSRLLIAYTLESADSKPFRIRRPVINDHTDWTGLGSGFNDLTEFPHHLRNIKKLGANLAIYTENSIYLATPTGLGEAPYRIELKESDVGLLCERVLQELPGLHHVFIGNENVYMFNGNSITPIADQIRYTLFSTLAPSRIRQMFSAVGSERPELLFFIATTSTTDGWPDKCWVYNHLARVWYPWSVVGHTCAAIHRLDDNLTWDETTGTWDAQIAEWNSRSLNAAYPAMLTGNTNGKVYIWGDNYASDDGTAFLAKWTSRDLESDDVAPAAPPSWITMRDLNVVYRDRGTCTLSFYVSIDGGATWDGPYTLAIGGGVAGSIRTAQLSPKHWTGKRIRFKMELTHVTETFEILRFEPTVELRAPILV